MSLCSYCIKTIDNIIEFQIVSKKKILYIKIKLSNYNTTLSLINLQNFKAY